MINAGLSPERLEEAVGFEWLGYPLLVWSKHSCGFSFVVFEQPAKLLTTLNGAFTRWASTHRREEQPIALALMIPLSMKMLHVLPQRMAE
jgi:hypothetical protein